MVPNVKCVHLILGDLAYISEICHFSLLKIPFPTSCQITRLFLKQAPEQFEKFVQNFIEAVALLEVVFLKHGRIATATATAAASPKQQPFLN